MDRAGGRWLLLCLGGQHTRGQVGPGHPARQPSLGVGNAPSVAVARRLSVAGGGLSRRRGQRPCRPAGPRRGADAGTSVGGAGAGGVGGGCCGGRPARGGQRPAAGPAADRPDMPPPARVGRPVPVGSGTVGPIAVLAAPRSWLLGPVAPERQMVSVNVFVLEPVGAGCFEDRGVAAGLTVPGVLRGGRRRSHRCGALPGLERRPSWGPSRRWRSCRADGRRSGPPPSDSWDSRPASAPLPQAQRQEQPAR